MTPLMRSGVQDAHAAFSGVAILAPLGYHATKEFNAFEGGAIICTDVRIRYASIR
jgi:hypothetical protein